MEFIIEAGSYTVFFFSTRNTSPVGVSKEGKDILIVFGAEARIPHKGFKENFWKIQKYFNYLKEKSGFQRKK